MIQGFNSDVKFRGIVYHVQTQDKGINNPKIETLIFKKGVILHSRILSYDEVLAADCLDEVVKEAMKQQHEEALMEIQEGKFFEQDDTDVSILRLRVREAFEHMILNSKRV